MATTMHSRHEQESYGDQTGMSQDTRFMYNDPAMLNPDELATFPKQAAPDGGHHSYQHNLHHGKRTPVRDGRNITRTDNHPDKKGFM